MAPKECVIVDRSVPSGVANELYGEAYGVDWEYAAYCCRLFHGARCENDAEFEIFVINGGPDPYSDNTHACEAHVGELLGHQPDCVDPSKVHWEVRPYEPR